MLPFGYQGDGRHDLSGAPHDTGGRLAFPVGALPFLLTPRHPTERALPVYCRTGPVFA